MVCEMSNQAPYWLVVFCMRASVCLFVGESCGAYRVPGLGLLLDEVVDGLRARVGKGGRKVSSVLRSNTESNRIWKLLTSRIFVFEPT